MRKVLVGCILKIKLLILGSEKIQKGGFFPIAAVLPSLAGEVVGKIFGRGKKRANKRLRRPSRKIILVSKRRW